MDVPLASPAQDRNQSRPTQSEIRRVVESAQQFEASLLESFLKPLEKAFSSVPGGEGDIGLGIGGFNDMGTQAVATAITRAGGIGIADLLVRNLLHLQNCAGKLRPLVQGGQTECKGFPPYADSN